MPGTMRLGRGQLRYLAAMERGGKTVVVVMIIIPILINFIWTIIYFKERTDDVYSHGPCKTNGTALYATPFFVTNRSEELWATQVVFTILTAFVWAPYRYLRPRTSRNYIRDFCLLLVDFLTLAPFLLSLIFPPAYVSYVPTFLRVWVVKYEALSLITPDHKIRYLTVYLFMDILSVTLSVIGGFEWSVNNFPLEPVNINGPPEQGVPPIYPCLSFIDSFYWFFVSFSTVGYGDVVPTNIIARMLVVLFILLFLVLLPEFVNKLLTIFHSFADLRDAKFTKSKKPDYIVVDGEITHQDAVRAMSMLQPKHFDGELVVSFVVALANENNVSDLVNLRDFRTEEYTRLVVLQGSLDSERDNLRARAAYAKAVYVLPVVVDHIPHPSTISLSMNISEATERTREFCMKRDFDTIRRVWAAQLRSRYVPIRGLLMHKANAYLVDSHLLDTRTSPACRCSTVNFMFADTFEQKVAAASALVPAYGTIETILALGGSCAHKSFDEYEVEATNLAAIEKMYKSHPTSLPDKASLLANQNSMRSFHGLPPTTTTPDDEEYIKSLRSTLMIIPYAGANPTTMGKICRHAFEARVLIMAAVPAIYMCSHMNFHAEHLIWSHAMLIMPSDWLICYGASHQIDIIRRTPFWQIKHEATIAARATMIQLTRELPQLVSEVRGNNTNNQSRRLSNPGATNGSTNSSSVDEYGRHWSALREGEFDHINSVDRYYLNPEAVQVEQAELYDTRAVSGLAANGSTVSREDSVNQTKKISSQSVFPQTTTLGTDNNKDDLIMSAVVHPPPPTTFLLRENLEGHIIVSSSLHDDYVYFIRKLRSRDLVNKAAPIVLLDSHPPNAFRWSEISAFENVFYLKGRPFVIDDLRRAGFEKASCLVMLTDCRAGFESTRKDAGAVHVDREHLLAEKVAGRLKRELNSPVRIITHVACEESCEFVGVDRMRKVNFKIPVDENETLAIRRKREAFDEIATLFESAWGPITSSSFISGECWSPACYSINFFAVECKGSWVMSFLEALADGTGTKEGLNTEQVPLDCFTFEEAVLRMLELEKGLVVGVYKNYFGAATSSPTSSLNEFRGCLMFPENEMKITSHDLLYIIRGDAKPPMSPDGISEV